MAQIGAVLRSSYVAGSRILRRLAAATGLLAWLDRRYDPSSHAVASHVRTLFAIHDVDDLVSLDVPWWTYGSIHAVERRLEALGGRARAFEYGSGASTVWLANRCGEVHSVEHDAWFATVMRRMLDDARLLDRVHLLEIHPTRAAAPVVRSGRRGEAELDYSGYVDSIERAGGVFDVICVDGRARVACLERAVGHLAPGGVIVFDDSQRPRYASGLARTGLRVRRIWGWVPSLPYPRQTALLSAEPEPEPEPESGPGPT